MCVCVYASFCVCICVPSFIYTYTTRTHIHDDLHVYIYIYIYIYLYIYIHTHIHICICICIYIYIYIYIYIRLMKNSHMGDISLGENACPWCYCIQKYISVFIRDTHYTCMHKNSSWKATVRRYVHVYTPIHTCIFWFFYVSQINKKHDQMLYMHTLSTFISLLCTMFAKLHSRTLRYTWTHDAYIIHTLLQPFGCYFCSQLCSCSYLFRCLW
jgi:hypothetical protein